MSGLYRRIRNLAGTTAGVVLALAGVPCAVAAAPSFFLFSASPSPLVAVADQSAPESSHERDTWQRDRRHSRAELERNERVEVGGRTVAPVGTPNNLAPSLPDATLQLPNAVPQLPNAVPQLPNAAPQLPNAVPQLPEAAPALPRPAPPAPGFEPLPHRP